MRLAGRLSRPSGGLFLARRRRVSRARASAASEAADGRGPRAVEGVAVSATTGAGAVAGAAESDARGRCKIHLAAPGKYVVHLGPGLCRPRRLRKDASNELRIDVGNGKDAIVLCALAARDAAATPNIPRCPSGSSRASSTA